MDDGETHEQVIRQLWDRAVPHFEVTNLLEILKQDIFEAIYFAKRSADKGLLEDF